MDTNRISVAPQEVTVGSFLRGLWAAAKTAWSLFTVCPHRNRCWTGYYSQKCYDCGRVRMVYSDSSTPWHSEVR